MRSSWNRNGKEVMIAQTVGWVVGIRALWSMIFRPRARITMFFVLAIAVVLVAITVAVHASGLSLLLPLLGRLRTVPPTQHWPITVLLIRVALLLIAMHVLEIT